jgi:hypothetical protein
MSRSHLCKSLSTLSETSGRGAGDTLAGSSGVCGHIIEGAGDVGSGVSQPTSSISSAGNSSRVIFFEFCIFFFRFMRSGLPRLFLRAGLVKFSRVSGRRSHTLRVELRANGSGFARLYHVAEPVPGQSGQRRGDSGSDDVFIV